MSLSEEGRCTRSLLNLCRMTKLSPQTQPLQICLGATTNKQKDSPLLKVTILRRKKENDGPITRKIFIKWLVLLCLATAAARVSELVSASVRRIWVQR